MVGIITNRDILVHPIVTIQCFGWRIFVLALCAGQTRTFLSLLSSDPSFKATMSKSPEFVDRCIELELRAKHIYLTLAGTFNNSGPARIFFKTLAAQEQEHADLLSLCKIAARRHGWNDSYFNPWEKTLQNIELEMQKIETSLYRINALPDALRLVVEIESSEVNRIFQAVLDASNSDFVRQMEPFQQALEFHIAYITEKVGELDASNANAVQELRRMYPPAPKHSSRRVSEYVAS